MITRRRFVGHAATTLAAGSLSVSLHAAPPVDRDVVKEPSRRSLKRFRRGRHLDKSDFESLVNEIFYIYGGPAGVVDLRLTAVEDGPRSVGVEQFFLEFRGPSSPALETGTYQGEHSRKNSFDIYLEKVGGDSAASYYSASFSHIV